MPQSIAQKVPLCIDAIDGVQVGSVLLKATSQASHFPDWVSITQLSWSTQTRSLQGETKPEDMFWPVMGLDFAGPGSPSPEVSTFVVDIWNSVPTIS